MVTIEHKDLILNDLTGRGAIQFAFDSSDISRRLGIDRQVVESIISHFQKLGFITLASWAGNSGGLVTVNVEAYDFARRGGFYAQEELLKGNIEKLGLEIDKLANDLSEKHLDTANKLFAFGRSILTAWGLMG